MKSRKTTFFFGFLLASSSLAYLPIDSKSQNTGPTQEDLAYQSIGDRIHHEFEIPANEAAQKKDFESAIKYYEKAATQWEKEKYNSEDLQEGQYTRIVSNLLAAGDLNKQQKHFDKAVEDYLKCEQIARVSKQRKNGTYLPFVAQAYREGRYFDKAIETYNTIIEKNFSMGPFGTDSHISIAQVYEDDGHPELAEKELRAFLDTNLKNCKPSNTRAARIAFRDMYKRLGRTSEADKMDNELNDKHCPICHSDSAVVPIGYGLPTGPADNNAIHLGGCMFSNSSPQWWCNKDKVSF